MDTKTATATPTNTTSATTKTNTLTKEKNGNLIDYNEFRGRLAKEYKENPDLCDPEDYERVMKNDFWVRRFVLFQNQGPEKGYQHMKECLEWRKKIGLNKEFDPTILPREVYQLGALFEYRPDKNGVQLLYMRGKMHFKVKELEDRIQMYVVHFLNKVDQKASKENGWGLVLDCAGTTYANADLDMLLFLLRTARYNFPCGAKYAVICGLPWILRVFASFVLSLLPSESIKKIHFVDNKKLFELIDEENVPDFLNGKCTDPYRFVPKCTQDCYTMGEGVGLSRSEVDSILKLVKDFLPKEEEVTYVDTI